MEDTKDDQVVDGVNTDEQSNEQSEEATNDTKTEANSPKLEELVAGLQKGYTLNAQALAKLNDRFDEIAENANQQSGAKEGDDEYVTVGKLKAILHEQVETAEKIKQQSNEYIANTLDSLKAQGIVKSKEDEDALLKYAVAKGEMDLLKAADRWMEVQQAREEGKKVLVEKKVQQEAGSKVGTSSKNSTEEQGGVDYEKIKRMDWFNL